jgi:uncharacterized protein (DUF2236 family)
MFSNGSVIRRVNREGVLLLGGGRALLLQLAHPLVARAVAEHSDFTLYPYRRLWRTLEASYTMVFGDEPAARATARGLWHIHEGVSGAGYRANDPDLLLWVHATLIETALRVHGLFFRPLTPAEYEQYYREAKCLAEALGVPLALQPEDFAAFRAYWRKAVGSLEVTPDARELAHAVLHPPLPLAATPLAELGRQLTIGLLPGRVRRQYGFGWGPRRESALRAAMEASRTFLPLVPSPLRHAPATLFTRAQGTGRRA